MPRDRHPFAINTYGYTRTHSAKDCLAHLATQGYTDFELMIYPGHLWPAATDAAARRDLRAFVEGSELRLITLNMPNIDINIAAAADGMRRYSLGFLHDVIGLAGDLGVPGVVVGPGKANPLMPGPKEELLGHFFRALDELAPHAERVGTALWVENMPFAFLPDADGLMAALERYGDERLAVVYDVANGHFIGESLEAGLRRVKDRLCLVHLSDTPREVYRHAAVGEGTVPFADVPPMLDAVGYRELPVLEIIADDPDGAIRQSVDRLFAMGWPRQRAVTFELLRENEVMLPEATDVVVVGAGNAALCAALAAAQAGASVLVLERAPEDERGGNTRFTAGAMRCAYNGVDDLKALMPDLSDEEIASTDFGTYSEDQFFDDMARVTEYRADPDLVDLLVRQSRPTLRWMREHGVRFAPMWGRQAFKVEGRFKFWGGLTIEAWGGGPGLTEALFDAAAKNGIEVAYEAGVMALIADDDGVHGVRVRHRGQTREVGARAVVLAAGGFEANAEWRTRYLGPGWDLAKVRGSRFNTGDGIRMALEIGAMPCGNWSGCHAVGWDRNAPEFGDLAVGDLFQKHSYPLGIMINAAGLRFVDEGADFRNYTYAKYGRAVLEQPHQFAWQIFDAKVLHLLRDEYRIREIPKVSADTLDELAHKLEGVNPARALETIRAFNAAVRTDVPFNPSVKDGRGTDGLAVPKSNWANPIDQPPFEAYQITCGITFTFGGLRITSDGQVVDVDARRVPGLYAAGELVGGLFYFNYPGGTGLMSGAVFGRIAGTSAGRAARGE